MSFVSDQQLIEEYLKGDEESLEILIRRYFGLIYNFIFRFVGNAKDAEDITQEVFARVWKNIKKFNPKKNRFKILKIKKQKSFKTWIFSIAKNASIDFLRKSRTVSGKRKILLFSEFEDRKGENIITNTFSDPSPLPDELMERADISNLLNSTLEKIPLKHRAVLLLHYDNHFTFREIAESLDEPINTVKSRHRRALIKLREIIS